MPPADHAHHRRETRHARKTEENLPPQPEKRRTTVRRFAHSNRANSASAHAAAIPSCGTNGTATRLMRVAVGPRRRDLCRQADGDARDQAGNATRQRSPAAAPEPSRRKLACTALNDSTAGGAHRPPSSCASARPSSTVTTRLAIASLLPLTVTSPFRSQGYRDVDLLHDSERSQPACRRISRFRA